MGTARFTGDDRVGDLQWHTPIYERVRRDVLEEAGTVATGLAYPCMRGARAAVLTGDPRQLMPFHARPGAPVISHLERFIDAGRWHTAFLHTTYRFGPATVRVLNQLVYTTVGKQLVAALKERPGVCEIRWHNCEVEREMFILSILIIHAVFIPTPTLKSVRTHPAKSTRMYIHIYIRTGYYS